MSATSFPRRGTMGRVVAGSLAWTAGPCADHTAANSSLQLRDSAGLPPQAVTGFPVGGLCIRARGRRHPQID